MLFTACSEDDNDESGTQPTADFAFKIKSDLTVTFTNNSEEGESYSWDFGDGGTSTDETPTHKYAAKESYTVTLTVTNGSKSDVATKTVNLPEDTPSVDIDGTFSDWSSVNGFSLPATATDALGVTKVKVTGDKNYIYFYAELIKSVTANFQVYMKLSNGTNVWSAPGQWFWPQSSIEVLAEFADLINADWDAGWGDVNLKGFDKPYSAQGEWPWGDFEYVAAGSGLFEVSALTDVSSKVTYAGTEYALVAIEIGMRKAILPAAITPGNVIALGFASSDASWTAAGQLPVSAAEGRMYSYNQTSNVLSE
jgi:PKD repeat protein